jgi:hypothetical protein
LSSKRERRPHLVAIGGYGDRNTRFSRLIEQEISWSDPTEQMPGLELPALIQDGYTSFKVFMTYEDLKLSDSWR